MADRPRMYDWADCCDYMDALETEVRRLRAALDAACQIALGTDLAWDAAERIRELQWS